MLDKFDFQVRFFEALPFQIVQLPMFQEEQFNVKSGLSEKIFSDVKNFSPDGLNAYFLKFLLTMKLAYETQLLELNAAFSDGVVPAEAVDATLEFIGFAMFNLQLLDSKYIVDGDYGDDVTFDFLLTMVKGYELILDGGKK